MKVFTGGTGEQVQGRVRTRGTKEPVWGGEQGQSCWQESLHDGDVGR